MTRWNLSVSNETDRAVQLHLARTGRARKGDHSRFIEEAVQARILELNAVEAKSNNSEVSQDQIEAMVAEAIDWARREQCASFWTQESACWPGIRGPGSVME